MRGLPTAVRISRPFFCFAPTRRFTGLYGMRPPPPTAALAELSTVLGEENVRTLVRTFLREFPLSFAQLNSDARQTRHRIAHSMKSNSRLMGALSLSQRMAEIEARLAEDDAGDVTPQDLAFIAAEFEALAPELRRFVGDAS